METTRKKRTMNTVCARCHDDKRCKNCLRCKTCTGCTATRCPSIPIPLLYKSARHVRNKLPRVLGVEFEISNIPEPEFKSEWVDVLRAVKRMPNDPYRMPEGGRRHPDFIHFHRDGSVQPSEFEAVFDPMVGDQFLEMLEVTTKVFDKWTPKGLECNTSTGYHCHVDASQSESMTTFRNFLYLYLKLEKEIYKRLCVPSRITNNCCIPLLRYLEKYIKIEDLLAVQDPAKFRRMIMSIYGIDEVTDDYDLLLANARFHALKGNRRAFGFERENNPRYSGMNVHALFHMGTLEWRMKEGTLDAREVIGWPLFCGWFTHLALTLPVKILESVNSLDDFLALPQLPKSVRENVLYIEQAVKEKGTKKKKPERTPERPPERDVPRAVPTPRRITTMDELLARQLAETINRVPPLWQNEPDQVERAIERAREANRLRAAEDALIPRTPRTRTPRPTNLPD